MTLPGDLAVHDPNPDWSEIHRVVGLSPRKRFDPGPVTTSHTVFKCITACDVEFDSLVEPTSDSGMLGARCHLCYTAQMGDAA